MSMLCSLPLLLLSVLRMYATQSDTVHSEADSDSLMYGCNIEL